MTTFDTRTYGWPWFRNEMRACTDTFESACSPFLDLIPECDQMVAMLVDRDMSYASDRPQDFVVAILSVRSFRLTISSLHLALSGYPDSSPVLDRSVFEIALRLLDLTTAPEAASFGFLIHGATVEIATMHAELEHRNLEGVPLGNLPDNLRRTREHVELLETLCRAKGIDPGQAARRHGRLNFRQIARDFRIEKAYLVDYAYASSHVHEKNVATHGFYSEAPGRRNFHLGPTPKPVVYAVPDSIKYLTTVLEIASHVLGDSALADRAESLSASYGEKLSRLEELI